MMMSTLSLSSDYYNLWYKVLTQRYSNRTVNAFIIGYYNASIHCLRVLLKTYSICQLLVTDNSHQIVVLNLSHSFNTNVNIWKILWMHSWNTISYSAIYLWISWPLMHNIKQQNEFNLCIDHILVIVLLRYHSSGFSDICSSFPHCFGKVITEAH